MVACFFLSSLIWAVTVVRSDQWLESDIDVDEFFQNDGAWVLFRKLVSGVGNNFGIGHNFTVTYQLKNIGTSPATNLKIEDLWDWNSFQRFGEQTHSEKIEYLLESLAPNEMVSKSYQLTPIQTGHFIPQRANLTYESSDDSGGANSHLLSGHSSAFIAVARHITNVEQSSLSSPHIIALSSSAYRRSIRSHFLFWIVFFVVTLFAIFAPLVRFVRFGGDLENIPIFGPFLAPVADILNIYAAPQFIRVWESVFTSKPKTNAVPTNQ